MTTATKNGQGFADLIKHFTISKEYKRGEKMSEPIKEPTLWQSIMRGAKITHVKKKHKSQFIINQQALQARAKIKKYIWYSQEMGTYVRSKHAGLIKTDAPHVSNVAMVGRV